jgi:hypothetical protein
MGLAQRQRELPPQLELSWIERDEITLDDQVLRVVRNAT